MLLGGVEAARIRAASYSSNCGDNDDIDASSLRSDIKNHVIIMVYDTKVRKGKNGHHISHLLYVFINCLSL